MSRGLGVTQRAILDTLRDDEHVWLTIAGLAQRLERTPRQILTAVRALEKRGLVVVTTECLGWNHGTGRLAQKRAYVDEPTVLTVGKGDPWPLREGYVAAERTEFYRTGTPVNGLAVWLPEVHQRHADRTALAVANLERIGR